MYGTGDEMLSGSGVFFAQNLIRLYTNSIGVWSKWIIIPASFAAMFSTTLTCLDAYPRSISSIQGLLKVLIEDIWNYHLRKLVFVTG